MTTPHAFTSTTQSAVGKDNKREVGVPCAATYSQFKFFLKVSAVPAFETE